MKVETLEHPTEIIEVDDAILAAMKERLATPKFVGPTPPESLVDRD